MRAFLLVSRVPGPMLWPAALTLALLPTLTLAAFHTQAWLGFAMVWLGMVFVLAALLLSTFVLADTVRWGVNGGYNALRLTAVAPTWLVLVELMTYLVLPVLTALSVVATFAYLVIVLDARPLPFSWLDALSWLLGLCFVYLSARLLLVRAKGLVSLALPHMVGVGLAYGFLSHTVHQLLPADSAPTLQLLLALVANGLLVWVNARLCRFPF